MAISDSMMATYIDFKRVKMSPRKTVKIAKKAVKGLKKTITKKKK
jgi:hypothetical protein